MNRHISNRNGYWACLVMVAAMVLAVAALSLPTVLANGDDRDGAKVFGRDSVPYGRTYSEWSAAWNQWSYSIPVAQHPLFDNGDCSVGQSGPVWFLGGKFCAIGATCTYTVNRNCSVPSGKAIFFPVADYEDSALEEGVNVHPGDPTYQQIAGLRSVAASVEGATDVFCRIDGKPVKNLWPNYSVQSVAFGFTIPDDNLLKAVYAPPNNFEAGTYFPGVDDGYYLMLAPLPPGNHRLHFGASWLDVTYNLVVAK
jgi:hypothetical protein